jgi:hypothetical protein
MVGFRPHKYFEHKRILTVSAEKFCETEQATSVAFTNTSKGNRLMIEIKSDGLTAFQPDTRTHENTMYIDEKQLTFVSPPFFDPRCFLKDNDKREYVGGWKFYMGVSGTKISCYYLSEEVCRGWFDYVLKYLREKQ